MAVKVATKLTLSKDFLAKALVAKTTSLYANESKYRSSSYEEDIYPQARLAFQEYNKAYKTNEELTKYFARDYNKKDPRLLKQIASETAVEEIGQQPGGQGPTAEQAPPAGAATGASAGGMPGLPSAPSISSAPRFYRVPHTPAGGMEGGTGQGTAATNKIDLFNASNQVTASSASSRKFDFRSFRFPGSFANAAENFGSRAGVFFQKNVGKYLTVGRIGTAVSTGIGAVAGAGFGPLGVVAGGGIGAVIPSWLRSGGGEKFFSKMGNGAINSGARLSNQVSRLSMVNPGKRIVVGILIGFLGLALGAGLLSALLPTSQPISTTPPALGPGIPPPQPGTGIIGCPVVGGRVTNGSKDTGGHCSLAYIQQYCTQSGSCTGCVESEADYTGRDKAVDIVGTFPFVYLPTINGKEVTWSVAEASNTISDAEGGGKDFTTTAFVEGKQYRARFVHLESIPSELTLGSQWQSNRFIGNYYQNNPYGAHLHITIQENGDFKPGDVYFNLCQ